MAQFSERDINEAKRRVQEMQNRASRLVNNQNEPKSDAQDNSVSTEKYDENEQKVENESDKTDKSFFIILALILLLSREEADNTLILALLYLLL